MFADLKVLGVDIDLGDEVLFYDEGYYKESPVEKIISIYSSYGLNPFSLNLENLNTESLSYCDSFDLSDGKIAYHLYYQKCEQKILDMMNRAHCESGFLWQVEKTDVLKEIFTRIYGQKVNFDSKDYAQVTNLAMHSVYQKYFRKNWLSHKLFMSDLKRIYCVNDFEVFKQVDDLYGFNQ